MTINDWKECRLGEVLNLKRGYDLPHQKRIEGEIPIVSSSGITGYHFESKAKSPGVVTGRYGTLGQVFYIEKDFWPLNTTLYVQDFKGNNPKFISYFLRTLNLQYQNGAAAVPGINRNVLHLLEVRIPPLPTQRKIASILSAYDDLIENNLRRIKILEEMAQLIYREWFVKFRFPGYENVKMVDSELGMIPEGWGVKTVNEIFEIMGGGTPSKKIEEYWNDGDIVWYVPRDLTSSGTMFMDDSKSHINKLGLKKSSAKLFPPYSVMMTSRATLGVVSINTIDACTNQGFITCIPNDKMPLYFLYFWLLENTETFMNMASGATFKEISKGVFKTIEIVLPPKKIVGNFQKIIEPFSNQILNFQRKNQNLRETRDLLLPKLISGELDVSEHDIMIDDELNNDNGNDADNNGENKNKEVTV